MSDELLPTLDEIKEIIDEEYLKIESEIARQKKKEQAESDATRIAEIKNKLSDS